MIALVQRVAQASVRVKGNESEKNSIHLGLLVLLGVSRDDTAADVEKIASKLTKLRVFSDEEGKMNLDINSARGELLLISQFTLIADTSGGNRPSFIRAAPPDLAKDLYLKLGEKLSLLGVVVKTGFFGEYMLIEATLDGPVTIHLNSKEL